MNYTEKTVVYLCAFDRVEPAMKCTTIQGGIKETEYFTPGGERIAYGRDFGQFATKQEAVACVRTHLMEHLEQAQTELAGWQKEIAHYEIALRALDEEATS